MRGGGGEGLCTCPFDLLQLSSPYSEVAHSGWHNVTFEDGRAEMAGGNVRLVEPAVFCLCLEYASHRKLVKTPEEFRLEQVQGICCLRSFPVLRAPRQRTASSGV